MASQRLFVGLDVGGTSMKAGVVDDDGNPLSDEPVNLPTEAHLGQKHGLKVMCETIRKAVQAAGKRIEDVTAIGVATPGPMDLQAGIIIDSPNLPHWENVPVRDHIQATFDKPTAFQNDANAAAYGEYWVGAGQRAHSMVLFTLGTGVGGGIILGDMNIEGRHSHGSELGHIKIEMTNPRSCGCGRFGCLEAYASATSVVARTREMLFRQGSHGSALGESNLDPNGDLTSRRIFAAAAAGDVVAAKIVDETAYYLAIGASNLMHTIDPDMVVFGGGMTKAGEPFLERIRWYVKQVSFPVPAERTEIRFAQLGSDAGYIGAAGCGRLLANAAAPRV